MASRPGLLAAVALALGVAGVGPPGPATTVPGDESCPDAGAPAPASDAAAPASTSESAPVTPEGFALAPARLVDPAGGATELCLWVADTAELWARGLMHVTDLGGADGMVFVFDEVTEARFYMWQTPRPLTIAFFDDAGRLVSTAEMKPCLDGPIERCRRYSAAEPYRMALEVPSGALDDQLVEGAVLELCPGYAGTAVRCESIQRPRAGPDSKLMINA